MKLHSFVERSALPSSAYVGAFEHVEPVLEPGVSGAVGRWDNSALLPL